MHNFDILNTYCNAVEDYNNEKKMYYSRKFSFINDYISSSLNIIPIWNVTYDAQPVFRESLMQKMYSRKEYVLCEYLAIIIIRKKILRIVQADSNQTDFWQRGRKEVVGQ